MTKTIRITACVLAATMVSGCQGFSGLFAFNGDRDKGDTAIQQAFGSEELERGRMALKAGHPARAIEQFRLAALNEEVAADAFNGLGVAYARLGREDLAERYFKTAMTLAPNNERFAANLARFYGTELGQSKRALAMREQEALDTLASLEDVAKLDGLLDIAPVQENNEVEITSLSLDRPAVRVTQRDDREIRIATNPQEYAGTTQLATIMVRNPKIEVPAPADDPVEAEAEAVAATLTVTDQRPKPRRTVISLLGFAGDDTVKPARIRISKPGSQGATRPRARAYPVRLSLRKPAE